VNGVSPDVQAFAGQAFRYHLEERQPAYDEIAWESSRIGALGTGARVLAALEPGDHTLVARLHDASAEVAVSVG
jgi:hypothetical protein